MPEGRPALTQHPLPSEPRTSTGDTAPLYARAIQRYRAGEDGDAERFCWEVLQHEPLHAEAIYLLGVPALDRGQTARALIHFHHATLLRPDHLPFRQALGEVYRLRGDRAEVDSCFRRVLRLDRNAPANHIAR